VVGGGNSAGQAAVFSRQVGRQGHLLVRKGLADSMISYLIRRIDANANITLHTGHEITSLGATNSGNACVEDAADDVLQTHAIGHVFLMDGRRNQYRW